MGAGKAKLAANCKCPNKEIQQENANLEAEGSFCCCRERTHKRMQLQHCLRHVDPAIDEQLSTMEKQQQDEEDVRWEFQPGRLIPVQEFRQLQLGLVILAAIPAKLTHSMISTLGNSLPLDAKHLKRVRKMQDAPNNQLDIIVTGPAITAQILHSLQQPAQPKQTEHGNGSHIEAGAETTIIQPNVTQPTGHEARPATSPALATEESKASNGNATTLASGIATLTDMIATTNELCINSTGLHNLIPEDVLQLIHKHSLQLKLGKVPIHPPQTRAQYEEWGKTYWPMTWKVPDGGETLSDEAIYASDVTQRYFERQLRGLLAAARVNGTNPTGCKHDIACNAARIVDPATGQVIGEGIDSRCSHPLRHAAMIAIQAAADRDLHLWPPTSDGEGQDRMCTLQESDVGHHDTACMNGSKRQKLVHSTSDCGMVVSSSLHSVEGLHTSQGCFNNNMQGVQSHDGTVSALPPKPYMCTGYDCFVLKEPCVMCAMGLVHSRVSRVIYCVPDCCGGALGGKFMLMKQRSLNHHYQVYHVPMAVSSCN